jgi:hypothetical protein
VSSGAVKQWPARVSKPLLRKRSIKNTAVMFCRYFELPRRPPYGAHTVATGMDSSSRNVPSQGVLLLTPAAVVIAVKVSLVRATLAAFAASAKQCRFSSRRCIETQWHSQQRPKRGCYSNTVPSLHSLTHVAMPC